MDMYGGLGLRESNRNREERVTREERRESEKGNARFINKSCTARVKCQ